MEKKMPDLCLSENTCQIISVLISELTLLCVNFILSHPLYFSYFIFFSPYVLKLISFLSPLFITTSLLLLALFTTISPGFINCKSSDQSDKVSVLFSVYHAVLDMLKSYEGDGKEFDHLEDFEVYKIVFQETPIEFFDYTSENSVLDSSVQEKDTAASRVDHENTLEELLIEMDEFERKTWSDNVERKKIEALGMKVDKVVEKQQKEETMIMGNGSKEVVTVDKVKKAHSSNFGENLDCNNSNNNNLGSYGSMRKEKEWTRTLACKLYEERHNASCGEGMDLLWETYELDSSGKSRVMKRDNNTKKKNMKKKGESKRYEEEDDDEEDMNEQLCCLQALKFSAGKMNLGMGRPNLVKFSKAIRGFGWLTKKNKVHCGDRF
ncbi:hypothetical protein K7X08_005031 [Anisodus acutangulus]|uniref:Uncharacterized protein n=1 Tax=Anisodus acutangulus TaxID=402998 RepID=A0A9Q1MF20_9SOLA|nr:hypothetical protein K7X08_005031 [Anisodus acutangulus]